MNEIGNVEEEHSVLNGKNGVVVVLNALWTGGGMGENMGLQRKALQLHEKKRKEEKKKPSTHSSNSLIVVLLMISAMTGSKIAGVIIILLKIATSTVLPSPLCIVLVGLAGTGAGIVLGASSSAEESGKVFPSVGPFRR
jgi:hypothetical protein